MGTIANNDERKLYSLNNKEKDLQQEDTSSSRDSYYSKHIISHGCLKVTGFKITGYIDFHLRKRTTAYIDKRKPHLLNNNDTDLQQEDISPSHFRDFLRNCLIVLTQPLNTNKERFSNVDFDEIMKYLDSLLRGEILEPILQTAQHVKDGLSYLMTFTRTQNIIRRNDEIQSGIYTSEESVRITSSYIYSSTGTNTIGGRGENLDKTTLRTSFFLWTSTMFTDVLGNVLTKSELTSVYIFSSGIRMLLGIPWLREDYYARKEQNIFGI